MTDPAILSRIQKLLALSRGVANEHEAALAGEKVRQLLEEHNLSLLDVPEDSLKTGEAFVNIALKTPGWQLVLANAAALLSDCVALRHRSITPKKKVVEAKVGFCGLEVNARAAVEVYHYFVEATEQLCADCYLAQALPRMAVAYRLGVADRIMDEVRKLKTENTEGSAQSTAIVRVGTALAKRYAHEKYAKRQSTRQPSTKFEGAYRFGYRAGGEVEIQPAAKRLKAGAA